MIENGDYGRNYEHGIYRLTTLTLKNIKESNELKFPNPFILLKIRFTLPVTSAEFEQGFLVIRRLRTWMRSSMVIERSRFTAVMNMKNQVARQIHLFLASFRKLLLSWSRLKIFFHSVFDKIQNP